MISLCLSFSFSGVRLVCVDVASDTEAVVGRVMKLTCIYCMKREEISAETKVDWFFIGEDKRKIYQFDREPQMPEDVEMYWKDRLTWKGSQDLQDISISILNVTLNDSGTYECEVSRFFEFNSFKHSTTKKTTIDLKVKMKGNRDTTALYSEIMMYVLLVFLTFWLLVEMIYCYRKISKSEEQHMENKVVAVRFQTDLLLSFDTALGHLTLSFFYSFFTIVYFVVSHFLLICLSVI
uniref:Sodium channel regulatory subunit beta-3 n=1 Tax=Sinocyclocheilus rhinocerous TaxID=307959 RepID=A0A673KPU1_9TELE